MIPAAALSIITPPENVRENAKVEFSLLLTTRQGQWGPASEGKSITCVDSHRAVHGPEQCRFLGAHRGVGAMHHHIVCHLLHL